MFALLVLCLQLGVTTAVPEYTFQGEHALSELLASSKPKQVVQKNVKTYIVTKRVPVPYRVQFETRVPYPVKVPVRRPYAVYVPKPYFVEIPKPVPYTVKVPVPQSFNLEKHVPYAYKLATEKPNVVHTTSNLFFDKLPNSLENKIPVETNNPFERPVQIQLEKPVSVPVEEPFLFPLKLQEEKPIQEKPSEDTVNSIVALPEASTDIEVPLKKEKFEFPSNGYHLQVEPLKGIHSFSPITQESLNNKLISKGKDDFNTYPTRLQTDWSPENKIVSFEPIVVPPDNGKWSNLNVSDWVPRFEITEIKTVNNEYSGKNTQKPRFEKSETKSSLQENKLAESFSKFQHTGQGSFVPSPTTETHTSYLAHPLLLHNEKQPLELSSTNNYQFFNVHSGSYIKPEALTSNFKIEDYQHDSKTVFQPHQHWTKSPEQNEGQTYVSHQIYHSPTSSTQKVHKKLEAQTPMIKMSELASGNLAYNTQDFKFSPQVQTPNSVSFQMISQPLQQQQPKHPEVQHDMPFQQQPDNFKLMFSENFPQRYEHIQLTTETSNQYNQGNFPQLRNNEQEGSSNQLHFQAFSNEPKDYTMPTVTTNQQFNQQFTMNDRQKPASNLNQYSQQVPEPATAQSQQYNQQQGSFQPNHFPQYRTQQYLQSVTNQGQDYWQHKFPPQAEVYQSQERPEQKADNQRTTQQHYIEQKRRQRQPEQTALPEQSTKATTPSTTTEEPTTKGQSASTTGSRPRRQRRKHRRRNGHEATTTSSTPK